jgi:hypothetical protein
VVSALVLLLSPKSLLPNSPSNTGMGGSEAPCRKQRQARVSTKNLILVFGGAGSSAEQHVGLKRCQAAANKH